MDDVNVLRQACCAFRNLFFKLVKMDPFRQAITISSICKKVFRTMFLKPDSVGIRPRGGYRMGDRQSVEALQWLAYIGRTRNNVSHAGNGREVHLPRISNVKFDGYCEETNEVFEYLGCFWHAKSTQAHWQHSGDIVEPVWGIWREAEENWKRKL